MSGEPKTSILHVTDCYDAGVFTAINQIARICDFSSHSLLYDGKSQPPALFRESQRFRSRNPIARVLEINRVVRKSNFNAVHLHSSRAGFLGRILWWKIKVIYQPHGAAFTYVVWPKIVRQAFKLTEKVLSRNTDLIFAVSKHEENEMRKISGKCPVVLLPNVSQLKPDSDNSNVVKKVVMSGRIAKVKGPDFFSQLALLCRQAKMNLDFVWIGEGDSALREALHDSGVRITGWLDEKQLNDELSTTFVYIHTAVSEGFPIVILDAAKLGVPIITRDIVHLQGYGLASAATAQEAFKLLQILMVDELYLAKLKRTSEALNSFHSESRLRLVYSGHIDEDSAQID